MEVDAPPEAALAEAQAAGLSRGSLEEDISSQVCTVRCAAALSSQRLDARTASQIGATEAVPGRDGRRGKPPLRKLHVLLSLLCVVSRRRSVERSLSFRAHLSSASGQQACVVMTWLPRARFCARGLTGPPFSPVRPSGRALRGWSVRPVRSFRSWPP